MGHNYNLRSNKQMMKTEDPPPPTAGDSNGDVLEAGPQHRALRNEYILKELFSHLSAEDLKECRLVNQVWSQVATRVFVQKAPVLKFGEAGTSRLEKFMDTMSNSENPPYRKFMVDSYLLYDAVPEQQLVLPKFIEKVAPIVTHLGVRCRWGRLFPWKKPKKRTEYPKLRSLELEIDPFFREPLKSNEEFMINILRHSPNLDKISILRVTHQAANRLLDNVPWSKIRHLKLEGQLEDNHFQKIMELGVATKLKLFDMETYNDVPVHPTNGTAFPKFLEQQSGSLEVLKLQFETWLPEPHSDFRFPRFPKLTTLEAHFSYFDNPGPGHEMYRLLSFPSFSQRFPALNSITVTGVQWPELCAVLRSEDSAPVETVKTLKFDAPRGDFGALNLEQEDAQQVIRHLGQMFPNIRKLVVPSDVDIMTAIEMEQVWQHLKDLTLLCGNNGNADVDCALFGHPPDGFLAYIKWLSNLEHRELWQQIGIIENDIFEFLQNLETLELDVADDSLRSNPEVTLISDLTCKFILLKLRNLKRLNLCGLGFRGITYDVSKATIQKMSAKFKVLYKDGEPEEEE